MKLIFLLLLISSCCSLPTIINTSIACDKTDFLLRIKFNETFTGLIQTEKGDPNCVYVNASIQRGTDYEVKIPLIGCETRRNDEGNYENEISVQNTARFDAKNDKRYLLTCIPANPIFRSDSPQTTANNDRFVNSRDFSRDSHVTVSFGGVTIDTQSTTVMTIVSSPKIDYQVSVRDGDEPTAPQLKRPLAVGDRVTYTVHLGPSNNGRIGRCWASDGKSELELSDNDGCSVQRAGEVWGDFDVSRDERGTTFLNHIKAWAFPTSNEVNIFCNLHVCADCTQVPCRSRPRRVPAVGDDMSSSDDDLSPPIPIHASFRLRRLAESTSASASPESAETQMTSTSFRQNVITGIISFTLLTLWLENLY
ncbi:hypothetical protein V3C99_003536, partial [Haemonchus contortus]